MLNTNCRELNRDQRPESYPFWRRINLIEWPSFQFFSGKTNFPPYFSSLMCAYWTTWGKLWDCQNLVLWLEYSAVNWEMQIKLPLGSKEATHGSLVLSGEKKRIVTLSKKLKGNLENKWILHLIMCDSSIAQDSFVCYCYILFQIIN